MDGKHLCLRDRYNSLPDLAEADAGVREGGRLDAFLDEAGPLFVNGSVAGFAGVGLLHRHNKILDNHLMFQFDGERNGEAVLICRHSPTDRIATEIAPILFQCATDAEFLGLEFSSDPLVLGDSRRLSQNRPFLTSYASLLREHGLERYLGIAMRNRTLIERPTRDLIEVEVTDVDEVSNIITLRSPDQIIPNSTVQTSWVFEEGPVAACRKYCEKICVVRSPGHANDHLPHPHVRDRPVAAPE